MYVDSHGKRVACGHMAVIQGLRMGKGGSRDSASTDGKGERRVRIGDRNRRSLPAPPSGSWIWWDSTADEQDEGRLYWNVRDLARNTPSVQGKPEPSPGQIPRGQHVMPLARIEVAQRQR